MDDVAAFPERTQNAPAQTWRLPELFTKKDLLRHFELPMHGNSYALLRLRVLTDAILAKCDRILDREEGTFLKKYKRRSFFDADECFAIRVALRLNK